MSRRRTIGDNPLDVVIPSLVPQRLTELARDPVEPEPVQNLTDVKSVASSSRVGLDEKASAVRPAVPKPSPELPTATEEMARSVRTERLTLHLSSKLVDRIRNAVYWTPGLTIAELAETALSESIDQLEAERGEAFVARGSELKRGRPIKL